MVKKTTKKPIANNKNKQSTPTSTKTKKASLSAASQSSQKQQKVQKTIRAKVLAKKTNEKKILNKTTTKISNNSFSSKKGNKSDSSAAQLSPVKTGAKPVNAKASKQPKNNKNSNDKNINTTAPNKNGASSASTETDNTKIVKLIEKGGAAVDHEVPNAADYYVLPDPSNEHNGKHFCTTLNLSDLKNNNNKFYLIQILIHSNTKECFFWNRWGRVGYQGQNSFNKCQDVAKAKKIFLDKYSQKTSKGYESIEIDYANEEKKDEKKIKKEKKAEQSEKNGKNGKEKAKKDLVFDEKVKNLLNLIFDLKLMNQQMKEIGYDANKMPLGKLSQQMIKDGYEVLRDIEQVLKAAKKGDLFELSSRFYTIIPHNFGYQ